MSEMTQEEALRLADELVQALECPVGENPSKVPPPKPTVIRPQRQLQVQVRRRASRAD